MENDPLTYEEQEQYANANFAKQQKQMSAAIAKKMNINTIKEHLVLGLVGGVVAGIMFGFMYGKSKSETPVRNTNGRVVEYKIDKKVMTNEMLRFIAYTMLFALAIAGIKSASESVRNRKSANKLAKDTMDRYFNGALQNRATYSQAESAATLILYNLPTLETLRLRALAASELKRNDDGQYYISDNAVVVAAQIISNFINYNQDVADNVARIMNDNKPLTYIMRLQQNTR